MNEIAERASFSLFLHFYFPSVHESGDFHARSYILKGPVELRQSFVACITTEASTCLATNLNSTLVIGCHRSAATGQIKKTWRTQRTEKTSLKL